MKQDYFATLKQYVEGHLSKADWQAWFQTHSEELKKTNKYYYLKLKLRGFAGAITILEQNNIAFKRCEALCQWCGSPLFHAVPHVTTQQEIIDFASNSKLRAKDIITQDAWIHPGKYCPNGCTIILINTGRSEESKLRKKLWQVEEEKKKTASITIKCQPSLENVPIKAYLNKNSCFTNEKEAVETIKLEPGTHTLIAYDYDPRKPNRRNSERLTFTIKETQNIVFTIDLIDDILYLNQQNS